MIHLTPQEMVLAEAGELFLGGQPTNPYCGKGRKVKDGQWLYARDDLFGLLDPSNYAPYDCGMCYACFRMKRNCTELTEGPNEYENWYNSLKPLIIGSF